MLSEFEKDSIKLVKMTGNVELNKRTKERADELFKGKNEAELEAMLDVFLLWTQIAKSKDHGSEVLIVGSFICHLGDRLDSLKGSIEGEGTCPSQEGIPPVFDPYADRSVRLRRD